MNNGEQLINFGIQLQNMGAQVQNFGMQIQNMIGIQMQNMGMQISNIGIQIFNIGKILNQNNNFENIMPEMIRQNQCMLTPFINLPQNSGLGMINNMNIDGYINNINNNNLIEPKLNITFLSNTGVKTIIVCDFKTSVEDLLINYAKREGISMNDIYNKKIYFVSDGQIIDPHDKTEISSSPIKYQIVKVHSIRELTN